MAPLNTPYGDSGQRTATLSRRRRVFYGALLVAVTAGSLYVAWLDRVIAVQFEGRRWNVPTQVYARPFELRPGLPLTASVFEQELKRHGYRPGRDARPGSYRRQGTRFDVVLRRARFADRLREAQSLRVVADGASIRSLRDAAGNDLPAATLEPLLVGSLFPVHGEDRIVVPPDGVPPLLPASLKVVEDRNFDSHPGIDVKAIARAAWVNLRAGRVQQGGSTLTQQLVKSYFLDDRRSLGRKLREAVMALLLERRAGKAELMNAYVNEIYLGQDGERAIHGFGLASRFYFGKPLDELDLAETALLVGMVRGPSYYNPRSNAERALARRNFVLARLAEFGVVPEQDAKAASKRPLGVVPRPTEGYYPAFLDFIRRELRRESGGAEPDREGMQVFTTLDPRIQSIAERALGEQLERLDRRRPAQDRRLEGAVVVTQPATGEVLAIVGGRRSRIAGFNRALDARRPIGSLVKPVVYLAALESGRFHAASILHDEPIEVRMSGGRQWRPQNFDREMEGPVPALRALAESRNLATVQLGLEVGLDPVARKFRAIGLDREPARLPALLLGAVELTPMEVAQVYGTFAAGGIARTPHAVRAIIMPDGRTLRRAVPATRLAADPVAVYQLNRMLTHVMTHGTGSAGTAALPRGLVTAGKTGTSSDLRDSWFAGFSGSHLAVVWVGHDDNSTTGLTGSQGALPVWSAVMAAAGATSWRAPMPGALEEVWIDYASGLVSEPACGEQAVAVALPRDAHVDTQYGCGSGFELFARRLRDWWRRFGD
ncbi:MAG TPA: penicillin-binding protein 1B [Steroidobacteraceae bacterium]|nr:penicillin-binding protein 1B [Steroidobacteraceae bacterium]